MAAQLQCVYYEYKSCSALAETDNCSLAKVEGQCGREQEEINQ